MKLLYFFVLITWISVSAAGTAYLARYENTAAETNKSYPKTFPKESSIERTAGQPTLVFFVHPKCPCTRASLHELSRLMTDVDNRLQVQFVIMKPENADANWTETDLRASAEAIPNAHVLIDEGGRETEIFDARTSGLILLYDRDGNLRYDGGITASRGHEGDNGGRQAIYNIVAQNADESTAMPVFGCPLRDRDCNGENLDYGR